METMTDTNTTRRPTRRYLMAIFATATVIGLAVGGTFVATSDATPSTARFAGAPVPAATQTVTIDPATYVCEGLDGSDLTACNTLAQRKPFSNRTISDPAGWKLVIECREDGTLSAEEFTLCLTQPANG
jgi:hypothetical protein